jgi:hypothetical protein
MTKHIKKYSDKLIVRQIIRICNKRGVQFYRCYSGRGMFGRRCIGITGSLGECAAIAEIVKRKTGKKYVTDSMGLDVIVYFPDVEDNHEWFPDETGDADEVCGFCEQEPCQCDTEDQPGDDEWEEGLDEDPA